MVQKKIVSRASVLKKKLIHSGASFFVLFFVFLGQLPLAALAGASSVNSPPNHCYLLFAQIALDSLRPNGSPLTLVANGTEVTLSYAFEKEGLLYSDIAQWFDTVDKEVFEKKLKARLEVEQAGTFPKNLTRFLQNWENRYRAPEIPLDFLSTEIYSRSQAKRAQINPSDVLDYLLLYDNPFDAISIQGREVLFYDGILKFDDLRASSITPQFIAIGDDLGSYEVRSRTGTADFRDYLTERRVVEETLEGPIGHQHLMHAWPKDDLARAKMAPQYIELLDATAWYLFWRQIKRHPTFTDSILSHPYLGVYNREALKRLYQAVLANNPKAFSNKYRMVGARNFKGNPDFEGQAGEILPDFELRSGNKTENRALVEGMLVARIVSGDYSGLPDFNSYEFDASTPLDVLLRGLLSESEIEIIQKFADDFPPLKWTAHPRAYNHLRNKIISPLLPWENRLNLGERKNLLKEKRKDFAQALLMIAKEYLKRRVKDQPSVAAQPSLELRWDTFSVLEHAIYRFAKQVRLDLTLEKLLYPRPQEVPSILVEPLGPIDVNEIPIGIEYSFRFSQTPRNREEAATQIKEAAEHLQIALGGGTIETLDDGGHGHGLSVRYKVTDLQGRTWRVEWDGIKRSYRDGKPYWTRGGHIETPTPKFIPKDLNDVKVLYQIMRDLGNFPKRTAGGAHVNVDLAAIRSLPEREGARKMANLIAYFEANRDLIATLWQNPHRKRTGISVDLDQTFIYQLNHFNGTWEDLGELLYNSHYFNTYIGRKPAYTQLNLLALMSGAIPEEYFRTIDIKKPHQKWFPAFAGKGTDRIEFRLFDAPEDEYIAALQIKYVRALLNYTIKSSGVIALNPKFSPANQTVWVERPEVFLQDAELHLKELELDPSEFAPLLRKTVDTLLSNSYLLPPVLKGTKCVEKKGLLYYFKRKIVQEEEEEPDYEAARDDKQ